MRRSAVIGFDFWIKNDGNAFHQNQFLIEFRMQLWSCFSFCIYNPRLKSLYLRCGRLKGGQTISHVRVFSPFCIPISTFPLNDILSTLDNVTGNRITLWPPISIISNSFLFCLWLWFEGQLRTLQYERGSQSEAQNREVDGLKGCFAIEVSNQSWIIVADFFQNWLKN